MPGRYPRLSRAELIQRLRAHATEHGFVSWKSLHKHDPVAQRSIMLHFRGLSDARHAARVSGAPKKPLPKKKRTNGAKVWGTAWSRERVIAELRRLHHEGQHTALTDLVEAGYVGLASAAREHAGGLANARKLAGIERSSGRTKRFKQRHSKESIVREIRDRQRAGKTLQPSGVPQHLYYAGRYQFGSWPAAIAAAGVKPKDFRPKVIRYTRAKIIEILREAARSNMDLTKDSLARVVRINAVRREFGTLEAALVAAGLSDRRGPPKLKMWDRERLIQTLRERAARGEHTFTPGLFHATQHYFGGAREARRAAGVPSPVDVRIAERQKAKKAVAIAERSRRRRRYE